MEPGEPYRSILYYRMAKTGRGHMPHLGAELVDEQGLTADPRLDSRVVANDASIWVARKAAICSTAEPSSEEQMARRKQAIDDLLSSTSDVARAGTIDWREGVLERRFGTRWLPRPPATVTRRFAICSSDSCPTRSVSGRLGNRIKPQQILALRGDAERGRALFFGTRIAAMQELPSREGRRGQGRTRADGGREKTHSRADFGNIAEPSKTIAQEYRTHLLETSDGKALSGIIVSKTENEIVLRDAQDKEMRAAVADIEQMSPQPLSMMPEGLLRDLTPQQAADLVEYLYSLK